MNIIPLLAATLSIDALIHVFIILAIVVLVLWGISALVTSMGWAIPRPVWIVFTVLGGIFLILWLAKLFGYAI